MPQSDRETQNRPDPDALLALAEKDSRGKLTVFLGAAPGVGKTYAMLLRARRLRQDGTDVVIGLVETHGRSETAALLEGLEILPLKSVDHRGYALEEFDIDGALARRPRILVVDELAHSNAPGSRHPKRYQDIEELIASGIDVWTALNIQHLESLSDVVARFTGVAIRERVPDSILSKADDVLLVDLPSAELIERLKAGKIYLPDNAKRAADRFFRLGNLTALRELALRRTADRVDDQMENYLKQNAIEGPWATGERLLVCVGPDRLSEKVVRTASRLASGLNAPWMVVSVERPDSAYTSAEGLRQIEEVFKLAEQLGAEVRRISGNDFVEEILKLARRERVTQIVIGVREHFSWFAPFRTSLPDALTRRGAGINIHLVTDEKRDKKRHYKPRPLPKLMETLRPLAIACASVAAALVFARSLLSLMDLPNASPIFLISVLIAATYGGYTAAFAAALLSVLTYNFFFIDPLYTFTITQPHAVLTLFIFLIAAILTGSLASRIREQAKVARERAISVQALYDFSKKLSGTEKLEDVLWAAVTQLFANMRREAVILMPQNKELKLAVAWPPDVALDISDMAAARWTMDKQETAGSGTGTLPNSTFQFHPLTTPNGVIGVCGLRIGGDIINDNDERTFSAILDQTAIAIDRARLSRESTEQTARLEGERFRSALLSSISHDLRTPLSTITGAITSLRQLGDKMDRESREDLLQSIEEESARLSRFVSNLLDMTRIEAGTLSAKREWLDVGDVVRASVERARKYFPDRLFEVGIAAGLPLMRGDSALLGQVLFNLLDNANKYGGAEPVNIYARRDGNDVVISVTDLGRGIPEEDLERIFEKFIRRGKIDGRLPGTGLGLSIAKGFVEAMGGRIKAESPAIKRKGTRIVMRFTATDAGTMKEMT